MIPSLSTIYFADFFILAALIAGFIALHCLDRHKTPPQSTITIKNHPEASFEVPAGTRLLTALTRQDILLPSACGGQGLCKKCKVQVLKGGGGLQAVETNYFSAEQLEEGWRLACQCQVTENTEIKLPPELLGHKEVTGKVLSNKNVATFIKELIVEVPETIDYDPGSYLEILIPPYKTNTSEWKTTIAPQYRSEWEDYGMFERTIDNTDINKPLRKAYSLASYPAEGHILIFNIRIASPPIVEGHCSNELPWGVSSSYLFSLKEGDAINIVGPFGEALMVQDERPIIFLIGGVGSSFGRSHLLHLFKTEKTQRKVSYWYGVRSLKDRIYHQELSRLDAEHDNLSYHLVLSEPDDDDLASGWPTDDTTKTNLLYKAFEEGELKGLDQPQSYLYYVCGPPKHNKKTADLLHSYGVSDDSIIIDDFGA
ncbi:MAG: NADH:ubiquinone reductase (Na(+)-transporting) subunit F [Chlamydiota bacterium]